MKQCNVLCDVMEQCNGTIQLGLFPRTKSRNHKLQVTAVTSLIGCTTTCVTSLLGCITTVVTSQIGCTTNVVTSLLGCTNAM